MMVVMYCKKCGRYVKGFKARVKHEVEQGCDGLTHFFHVLAYNPQTNKHINAYSWWGRPQYKRR